jgi:hypothetical protein
MSFLPGPAVLFGADEFDLTPEPPEFEAFATEVEAAVLAAEGEAGLHATNLAASSAEWVNDVSANASGLDEAEQELGVQSAAPLALPDTVTAALPEVDAGIDDAAGRLPAEAFLADAPPPPAVEELVPSPEPPPGQTVPPPLTTLPLE